MEWDCFYELELDCRVEEGKNPGNLIAYTDCDDLGIIPVCTSFEELEKYIKDSAVICFEDMLFDKGKKLFEKYLKDKKIKFTKVDVGTKEEDCSEHFDIAVKFLTYKRRKVEECS